MSAVRFQSRASSIKVEILIENINEHFNCSTLASLQFIERALRKCSVPSRSWSGFEKELARVLGISLVKGARVMPAEVGEPQH